MVDRVLEYPIEVPICEDDLRTNRNFMVGLGKLAEALIGKETVIQGLLCKPNTPADLEVLVEAGQIFSWQNIDDSDYSELPQDTAHQIVKQGLVLDETTLSCPAPVTSGFSINYLVQIEFQEIDNLNEQRAFYNSADPAQPFYVYKDSQREDKCLVTVKAGTAATTGTQVTPPPDANNVGAWVVTVDEGQTTITAVDIVEYPDAPFIKLARDIYSATTEGTPSTYTATIPGLSGYFANMVLDLTMHAPNTGGSTINVNGFGAKDLLRADGTAMLPNDLPTGAIFSFAYTGTAFRLFKRPASEGFLVQQVRLLDGAYQNLGAVVIPADNTKPQITEGAEIMSQVFTPRFATSKILVEITAYVTSTAAAIIAASLFKDSDVDALATGFVNLSAGDQMSPITFRYVFSSVSLTQITFSVRTGGSAGTIHLNGTTGGGALYNGTIGGNIIISEYTS